MVIVNLCLKLAVGGAVKWRIYIRRTDFRITGVNLYLIALTILVILSETVYM